MGGRWVAIASFFGLTSVAAGAFGAHALSGHLSDADLATFEVAVRYQMYHGLALLGVASVSANQPSRSIYLAGVLFSVGVLLFSGSLYGLSLLHWRWLGPVTPIGGLLFMVGWVMLGIGATRKRPSASSS